MTRPAFIVEGHLEQDFVQTVCEGSPVRRIGCNGTGVKIEAIAKHVATHARLLQKRFDPIIIVFDRERRIETCECLEKELKIELQKLNVTVRTVVGIPDRDIESWILADYETFATSIGIDPIVPDKNFEGEKCKGKIKELAAEKFHYNEIIHGVAWLKNAKPYKMKVCSPSFSRFYEQLSGLVNCRWLQQESPLFE
ncbi:MAG: DUF4276 family protein [Verrucomicrobiota bacterium]|jgi:hypothetical protein